MSKKKKSKKMKVKLETASKLAKPIEHNGSTVKGSKRKQPKPASDSADPSSGRMFADPRPSPDDLSFDASADSGIKTDTKQAEPFPTTPLASAVITLEEVIGTAAVSAIQKAGQIVFHCVGDTGGVKSPAHQFLVADKMELDYMLPTLPINLRSSITLATWSITSVKGSFTPTSSTIRTDTTQAPSLLYPATTTATSSPARTLQASQPLSRTSARPLRYTRRMRPTISAPR